MSSFTHTWLVSNFVTGLSPKVKKQFTPCHISQQHMVLWGVLGVQSIAGCWNWTWHLLEAEAIKQNYREWNLCKTTNWRNLHCWRLWDLSYDGEKSKDGVGKVGQRRWSRNRTLQSCCFPKMMMVVVTHDHNQAFLLPRTIFIHANGGVQPTPLMNTAAIPVMHIWTLYSIIKSFCWKWNKWFSTILFLVDAFCTPQWGLQHVMNY